MSQAVQAAPAPPGSVDDRVRRRSLLASVLSRPEVGSLVGAVAVFALFFAVAPTFRQAASFATVLYAGSTIGIMALAVALLMIGGEFDLSAGVAVTTSALFASTFAYQLNLNLWVGVAAALVVSLGIGAFNGWLLMRTGLPSFLITLGTFFILQGVNLGVTKLLTGNVSSTSVSDMDGFEQARAVFASTVPIGGVSVKITVFWWLLFVAIGTWVLLRTKTGNWIFAAGGDKAAARAVGVPVRATKIGLFMTVGFMAWFVGMHQLFSFNAIQSGGGVGQEFIYIIAAVVGGCLLTGGYGSAVGSAIGALIFGMTSLGIVYAGWDANWFKAFLGVMLLLATIVNMIVKNQAAKR
ncbi:simple sugar transport system permease protein [Kineococcus xinjiangensis]|uniref:Xylose transport system permease protein XylH n=1 Tax=Kineococcus xinjiangensis TaxID=512762 RepID=A0A2S6IUC2_9ACTN|nr:ABC transporter permease [Kineococcus xinjiangensis]PPK97872.1 simple sugar transport system permease protein [Kineococcus xinjiangensis]